MRRTCPSSGVAPLGIFRACSQRLDAGSVRRILALGARRRARRSGGPADPAEGGDAARLLRTDPRRGPRSSEGRMRPKGGGGGGTPPQSSGKNGVLRAQKEQTRFKWGLVAFGFSRDQLSLGFWVQLLRGSHPQTPWVWGSLLNINLNNGVPCFSRVTMQGLPASNSR